MVHFDWGGKGTTETNNGMTKHLDSDHRQEGSYNKHRDTRGRDYYNMTNQPDKNEIPSSHLQVSRSTQSFQQSGFHETGSKNQKNYNEIRWPKNGTNARWLARSTFFFVFADAAFLRSKGAERFAVEWRAEKEEKNLRRNWFVPQFEAAKLTANENEAVSSWGNTYSIRTNIRDYDELFESSLKNHWNIVFLSGTDEKKHATILDAANRAGARVQIYSVTNDGLLSPASTKYENRKHNYRGQTMVNHNAFAIPSEVAIIRPNRVIPSSIPAAGDSVFDDSGSRIYLIKAVTSNATSITYTTNNENYLVKVYIRGLLESDLPENKAKLMLSRKVDIKGVCWPISLVKNDRGAFVGILVPRQEGKPLREGLLRESTVREHFKGWNKKDLAELALTILNTLEELQSWNIFFGLLNPATIYVKSKTEVFLSDMDEWQIEGYPVLADNKLYLPPELQRKPAEIHLYTKDEMNYQVAVLMFMLMMPGRMPYVQKRGGTVFDSIVAQDFAFGMGDGMRSTSRQDSSAGFWRFVWDHLSYDLGKDLYQSFARDAQNSTPGHRLSLSQWKRDMYRYCENLNHPYDPESLQLYPASFRRAENRVFQQCSFCGKQHPTFYFQKQFRIQVDHQWKSIPLEGMLNGKRICKTCFHESAEKTDPKDEKSFYVCAGCGDKVYYTNAAKYMHTYMEQNQGWVPQKWCANCKELYEKRTCIQCGEEFDIIVGQYRAYGVEKLPKRCPKCRNKRVR